MNRVHKRDPTQCEIQFCCHNALIICNCCLTELCDKHVNYKDHHCATFQMQDKLQVKSGGQPFGAGRL